MPWSWSSSGDYTVRMFIPSGFEGKPPVPNPELKLRIEKWKSECIAVRKFSGYAKDDNINKEMEALVTALNKQSVTIQDTNSYIIANYNASSHNTTQRLNEVWINVSGLTTHCWLLFFFLSFSLILLRVNHATSEISCFCVSASNGNNALASLISIAIYSS